METSTADRVSRSPTAEEVGQVTLALLAQRSAGATICPSEVARALVPGAGNRTAHGWRHFMPMVHAAVDNLVRDGAVALSWKGAPMPDREGPYRIGRPDPR